MQRRRSRTSKESIDRRRFLKSVVAGSTASTLLSKLSLRTEASQHGPRTCGGLAALVSRRPVGRPMSGEALRWLAQQPGTLSLLWRPKGTGEWKGSIAAWKRDETDRETLRGVTQGEPLFAARLSTADFADALRLTVRATTQREAHEAHEVVLGAAFEPTGWERQFYPKLPYLVLKPGASTTVVYLASADDTTEVT